MQIRTNKMFNLWALENRCDISPPR